MTIGAMRTPDANGSYMAVYEDQETRFRGLLDFLLGVDRGA